ncbi:MAG: Gfo/Idh/MocA family oxidoreductase [Kiritimatiellae bacterium]|nr:Gfo/Idh/MocA family oxidoreductase [Kiritimatiellia bacterium]MDD5522988.1 Gfo/Idh/MocA family oxidoreductase [Kiritimatiellia bacterium]
MKTIEAKSRSESHKISRRCFLEKAALAGVVIGFPTIIPSTVLARDGKASPNSKVNVAMISCGSRAGYAVNYKSYDKSVMVAVCDPIKSRRLKRKQEFGNCDDYGDFREVLARKDVDAVHIATADHWHVPIAMMAAWAGKDMYTEKPLGISIEHDKKSREIVDKYHRIFQYGAQQRSIEQVRLGIELVLNGHIGEVKEAFVWAPHGESGGIATEAPIPEGFDYDMWLGPAPKAPFCNDRCLTQSHRNGIFHIYDYAIGFVAGWGAHPADMLQWWLDNAGIPNMPVSCEARGVIPTSGLFNTLTNWDSYFVYPNGLKMRFMDDITADKEKPHPGVSGGHGTLLVGSEGWVRVSRGGWAFSNDNIRQKAKDPGPKRLKISRDQIQNFVDCVLSREEPVDNLHSAVRSDILCHLIDISVRTGRKLKWDNNKEKIVGDKQAENMMRRDLRDPWKLNRSWLSSIFG